MERLTISELFGGYSSTHAPAELLIRLGKLEDMYDALLADRARTILKIDELRRLGKSKSIIYQQCLASKLMLQNLIDRFDIYTG